MPAPAKPRFFAKPETFGRWLERNAGKTPELLVGFWKVGSGKASMTWAQSVEQALMHGWIDGVRRSLGDDSYTIRFTPRRKGSNWSNINLRLAKRLIEEGRMAPAGRQAYEARRRGQPALGSYEQAEAPTLSAADLRRFKQEPAAWAWFKSAAPSYQRACAWWIQSAKKPETRQRRLEHVIQHSKQGSVVPQYRWRKVGSKGKLVPKAKTARAAPVIR